jgi:hypothetical protein
MNLELASISSNSTQGKRETSVTTASELVKPTLPYDYQIRKLLGAD